jgi:general stress protein CsbA
MQIAKWKIVVFVLAGLMVMVGLIATEYADKKFWWIFWDVIAILGGAIFIGMWLLAKASEKKDKFGK